MEVLMLSVAPHLDPMLWEAVHIETDHFMMLSETVHIETKHLMMLQEAWPNVE